MSDDKLALLQKLKALAEKGVGGERINAQRKLDELMRKHDISETELSSERKTIHTFKYSTVRQRKLLLQICFKVTNTIDEFWSYKYEHNILYCRCTDAQFIEIDFLFDFYKRLYKKEEEFFFSSFIQKHDIFGDVVTNGGNKLSDADYLKMQMLMRGMSDETPLLQIKGDTRK